MRSRIFGPLAVLTAVVVVGLGSISAVHAVARPAAPTGVKTAPTWNSAAISWKPVSGATSYTVCLLTSGTATSCRYSSGRVTRTSHTFTGLRPTGGRDYYVKVAATNSAGSTWSAKGEFDLAADPRPPAPTNMSLRLTSPTSAQIAWTPGPGATSSALCVNTVGAQAGCEKVVVTTGRTATIDRLAPTSGGDYYYRVISRRAGHARGNAEQRLDLPPQGTATVTAKPGATSAALSWAPTVNANRYHLQYSTSSSMAGATTLRAATSSTTVTRLSAGRTYYVRARGVNDNVAGAWSRVTTVRTTTAPADVRVITYNLCGEDRCIGSGSSMKPWASTRKKLAGAQVRADAPDVVATQESHEKHTNFVSELPGFGTAAYYKAKSLFYDKSALAVERSGSITLSSSTPRYAVWAQFRSLSTGARFIVADAHLEPYKGRSKDVMRSSQTSVLIDKIAAANTAKLPVVYAGDYNSNASNANQKNYPGGFDAPTAKFTAAGIPDAIDVAPSAATVGESWNSANQGVNPPKTGGYHVDKVFVSDDVDVRSWRVLLRASSGRYWTPFASDHNPVRVDLRIPAP